VSRITFHLDPGLGWTKPQVVASCRLCGTELTRHPNLASAARAARRVRCPGCGTRAARRLPGTTSPTTDLALTRPRRATAADPSTRPIPPMEGSAHMPSRSLWQIDMGDGTWAVCCTACRLALYRGPKAGADRAFRGHRCEPVLPLGRRRRRLA
jgi:hypothetical protein